MEWKDPAAATFTQSLLQNPTIPDLGSEPMKVETMSKNLVLIVTFIALVGAVPLLAACHTTAGAGEDISKTGQAIEKSAERHAP